MNEEEKESGNFAKITLKKSSSSGKLGFDIQVKADGSITQDQLVHHKYWGIK